MARRLISTGSTWEREVGYSRVVVDDEWAFVSGTTGFDYATMTISPDVADQAKRMIRLSDGEIVDDQRSVGVHDSPPAVHSQKSAHHDAEGVIEARP